MLNTASVILYIMWCSVAALLLSIVMIILWLPHKIYVLSDRYVKSIVFSNDEDGYVKYNDID